MKKLTGLLGLIIIASGFIFTSCSGKQIKLAQNVKCPFDNNCTINDLLKKSPKVENVKWTTEKGFAIATIDLKKDCDQLVSETDKLDEDLWSTMGMCCYDDDRAKLEQISEEYWQLDDEQAKNYFNIEFIRACIKVPVVKGEAIYPGILCGYIDIGIKSKDNKIKKTIKLTDWAERIPVSHTLLDGVLYQNAPILDVYFNPLVYGIQ